jgi:DIS3-like exonuclease 2
MLVGRRDYRDRRVFTIDPTSARDLDDALHVASLPDGRVEIGVHIADVSHFLRPGSAVDAEALRRATTVYLVNDVIPMLPRPLCEVACSLNENVERLAFSCIWRMNMDGTMAGNNDVWYGRTVIKSCARLDYATAQNIIDGKCGNGEGRADEVEFWPTSRRPTGGHTVDGVAADVRLMHRVAMARRRLRFENGALALNGIKLAFQLEEDGETPRLCAPYPIRDSNRLIEEYMLIANYLVAQRLITHARGRALLRHHPPPLEGRMQQVVDVSKEAFDFDIDVTNSKTLQESLSKISRDCDDELVVQCVTESLMNPMRPAQYMAAGEVDDTDWQHFALNIPYYTHFTSPIRRYPDVVVHRLLQATLDDDVDGFPMTQQEIQAAAGHCNDMRMAAKKAQERSDRVFLSLYLKRNPISSALGVCLGVGEKTFTCFVPSLGMSTRVFLQEHEDEFDINAFEDSSGKRRIVIQPKTNAGVKPLAADDVSRGRSWKSLEIGVFTKLEVACSCKCQPPIDVRVKVVGPWVPGRC